MPAYLAGLKLTQFGPVLNVSGSVSIRFGPTSATRDEKGVDGRKRKKSLDFCRQYKFYRNVLN